MEKKKLLSFMRKIVLILIVPTLILSVCSNEKVSAASTESKKIYNWKAQLVVGVEGIEYKVANEWSKQLETLSGGRLKISIYPAGAIVKTPDILDAIGQNTIQVGEAYGGYWKGFMPEGAIEAGVPMQYRSEEEYFNLMYGYGLAKPLAKAYEEKGAYLWALSANAPFGLWSKKPIRNMSELKGLKVRAVGELADVLAKMKAAPVYIPHEESFMALQLGTIDAYSTGIHCWKLFKHYEICHYIMLPAPMPCGTDNYVISLKALNQLPPDLQTLVKAFGPGVGYFMSWKSREMADFILKEAPSLKGQLIHWDEEVVNTLAKEGLAILKNKYAPKSDRARSMVNIVSTYMKDKGYIK